MPLPPALLAKLAKRGLVEQSAETKSQTTLTTTTAEEEEEVFAEDYDDPSKPEVPEEVPEPAVAVEPTPEPQPIADVEDEEPVFYETTACPNRLNPYHTCVPYCKKKYGMREWAPDSGMLKRRERMLRKYPLPEGWVEVGDHDSSRYYYWNIHTDQVSWLSPTHPKAQISQSAEKLGLIGKLGNLDSDGEENMDTQSLPEDNVTDESGSDTSLSDEEEMEEETKIESRFGTLPPIQTQGRQNESRRGHNRPDDLDPMDPAAYSDIERGGWNEGLDTRGKAKTGVDVTASGPLFQQRPYPSPGDILRANQTLKKKK